MFLDDKQLRALLLALADTHADEIDCEQCLVFIGEYSELRAGGRPLPEVLASVEAHLRLCLSCREECQALIGLLRENQAEE
jgi:hypothetical protein